MTLTRQSLRQWEQSMHCQLSALQRQLILDRFADEPEFHEWSVQDIAEQIRIICLEYPAVNS